MPTYDYRCEACGAELEVYQSISESPKRKCPTCGKLKLKRQIGAGGGFLFRGSGFYLTDYRSDSYRKAHEAETKPAESKETKPDAPKDAPKKKEKPSDGASGAKAKAS